MHLLNRILVRRKPNGGEMKLRRRGREPKKLERRNAMKDVDYDASLSSASSLEDSGSFCSQSLDLSSLADHSSFRVEGVDDVDRIIRMLGLSGPEEFEIPAAGLEDLNPPPGWRLGQLRSERNQRLQTEPPLEIPERVEREDGLDVFCVLEVRGDSNGLKISSTAVGSVGCGIKRSRPPLLARPPPMTISVADIGCSTKDILRSFAPEGMGLSSFLAPDTSSDEEVDAVSCRRAGFTGVAVGDSPSFTTSNDDDSSSTCTDPMSSCSPIVRSGRSILCWERGLLLGRGSFGSVYEGIADDGFYFAVKEVSLLDQGSLGKQSIYQLEQEIALLSNFKHNNIVQYYGTYRDESKFCIFLEHVSLGSLQSRYRVYNLRDSHVSAYTRQILHGLKYLHDQNVVHRDIKCANILVDTNGSVKLSDFGLAKATKLNDVKSCKGSPFWMAPEVVNLRNDGYGLPADIWSLGCTVLEMLTHRIPYSHLEDFQALFRIGKGEPPPVPNTLSNDAREFIRQCLQVNPSLRPTAGQLLELPFVKKAFPTTSATASPHNYGWHI